MKKVFLASLIFIVGGTFLQSDGFLGEVTKHLGRADIFEPALEAKRKFLADLAKEQEQLESTQKEFTESIEKETASIENQIALVKEELLQQPDDDFLLKKQSLLNDQFQVLKDKIKVRSQLIEEKKELIKVITDFLADPNLEEFKKEQKLFKVAAYSFEDIQTLKQKVIDGKKNILFLKNQDKNVNIELESRKRIIASLEETFKKKQIEFETAMTSNSQPFDFDKRQIRELFTLEEKLYNEKQDLEQLRLKEIETKKELIKRKKIIADSQLDALKTALEHAKSHIRITEADIVIAKDDLTKKEHEYFNRRETFSKELERRKTKDQELEELSRRFNIPLGPDLDDWSRKSKQTVEGYIALFEVGTFNDQVLLVRREKEFLEARMELEREKFESEAVLVTIKETYYKITAQRFKSTEEVTEEEKKYEALKAKANAAISLYEGRKNIASDQLDIQKKSLENIKEHRKEIEKQATVLFKNYDREYSRVISLLNTIEENILKQIDILGKIINVYNDIITINKSSLQQIDLVVPDLPGLLRFLRRPEAAISWKAVSSIIPDSRIFITDLYNYLTTFSFDSMITKIKAIIDRPYEILFFFIKLLLLALFLFLLRIYLPKIDKLLRGIEIEYYLARLLILFALFLITFFVAYFLGIALWLLTFFVFYHLKMIDPYLTALFYIGSIPYFLYIFNRLICAFIEFNKQYEYCFVKQEFQRRFTIVFSVLIYATIFILLFKESFQLLVYPKSELPRTLGAINFIILQLALIFLLSKEQILDRIPTTTAIGHTIRNFVDSYFYMLLPFVITIIIMSNPYVGYGPLVLYILSRLFYTILIVTVLFWLHKFSKRISSKLFFSVEEGVAKERFSYAKTWYGFFVIITFITLILIGIFIGAKIWDWPETLSKIKNWKDIREWIYMPIMLRGTEAPISAASILQFLSFILAAALIFYAFNRFVLGRIFDVLLVEPGIQNAVVTITRYLIIFTAIVLGFQAIGLGQYVGWLFGFLVLSIGWVIKDPVSDFVAYMIILVQRPLKIGDYVKLDEQTMGVVRKITPRAVILRRKNSTTYIVPNSQIIKKVLINWNYRPGFVAFEDIHIMISYKDNPTVVRDTLLQVLDKNPYILKSPKPVVRLDSFGEYGYLFMIRGFVSSNYTLEIWNIASSIRIEITHELRKRGIEIAVPIRKIIELTEK